MSRVRGLALREKSEVDFTEMMPLHVVSKYLLVLVDPISGWVRL